MSEHGLLRTLATAVDEAVDVLSRQPYLPPVLQAQLEQLEDARSQFFKCAPNGLVSAWSMANELVKGSAKGDEQERLKDLREALFSAIALWIARMP